MSKEPLTAVICMSTHSLNKKHEIPKSNPDKRVNCLKALLITIDVSLILSNFRFATFKHSVMTIIKRKEKQRKSNKRKGKFGPWMEI